MSVYLKFVSMFIKCEMQYKTSFFMLIIGQFLVSFTTFFSVYFIFERFNTVNGFTFSQTLLCFSILLMAYSLAEVFVRGFDRFPTLIRSGQLDRILIRPRNVVFQVLTSNIDFSRFGRFFQGVIMLVYAIMQSGVIWTHDKIFTMVLMLLGGFVVFSGLFMLYAGMSFFTIEGIEFMNIFTDGSREFGKYPLSIYGDTMLKIYTYIVPIALFQYYPFLYIIGHSDDVLHMLSPLFSFLFIIPCYAFFRFGLSKYKSTGS